MLEKIRQLICRLLGIKAEAQSAEPDKYVQQYEDITGENITATIAGKLAMLTFADSSLAVDTTAGKRAELIQSVLDPLWQRGPGIVAQALGKGGKVLVPTAHNGHIDVYAIDQNRMVVRRMDGEKIVEASLLSDVAVQNDRIYYLLADYVLEKDVQTIRYRVSDTSGAEYPLTDVAKWASTEPEYHIAGVDRLLFGFLRCPRDNRRDDHVHGVPITYGAENDLAELVEHMRTYRREFKLSRMMLGLDSSLWKYGRDNAPTSIDQVKQSVQDGDSPFVPIDSMVIDGKTPWQQYAPAIRYEAMEARYSSLCRRLEKACGLSQGVLTERQSVNYANKDEVRAAQYDTFAVVTAIRLNWEKALDDVAYAVDVLAEYFGLTPAGARNQYEIAYDWDTSLVESSTEAFAQLSDLQSRGAASRAELRQFVRGGSLKEAQQAVDEIRAMGENSLDALLTGGAAGDD